jgi:Na+-transporting methylmalonyl-CoA/oxaloacetate decarboxylase gamma subunit
LVLGKAHDEHRSALASSRAALVSTLAPKRLALVALLLGCWNPRALPLLKNSEAVKEERPENETKRIAAKNSKKKRTKSKRIATKLCTGHHKRVSEHTSRDHRPISSLAMGNFRSSQKHKKKPQKGNMLQT